MTVDQKQLYESFLLRYKQSFIYSEIIVLRIVTMVHKSDCNNAAVEKL